MLRVTFGGDELAGFEIGMPAASVRLLVPTPADPGLEIPIWSGNEFLRADGTRPVIRTYTPLHFDSGARELNLDVVLHDRGAVAAWAASATPGDPAAVSGPGRGYEVDPSARSFLLAGDETAIPAISQLMEHLPAGTPTEVMIEVAHPEARQTLSSSAGRTVSWLDLASGQPPGDALVAAVEAAEIAPEARLWVAGEAAAVQRIRRNLFEQRGMPRTQAVVRGYWKQGEPGTEGPD